jgi:RNA polymerase sigma-B factor
MTGSPSLTGLDDGDLLAIVRSLPQSSQRRNAACEVLVTRYSGLVRACVRRYSHVPDSNADLMQVGYLGLVKAINNFDPVFGRSLAAYAQPCISGEIKRHFRDGRWQIHVTRSVKELAVEVRVATSRLTQDLGRTPSAADLARHLGVSGDELREAQLAELAFRPASLEAPLSALPGAGSLADLLGQEDARLEHALGMQAVATHWGELSAREQEILQLNFFGGLTQDQIGAQLGISQMQVSRLRARALSYLRPRLLGPQHAATAASDPDFVRPHRKAADGMEQEAIAGFGAGYAQQPGKRIVNTKLRTQARVPA